MKNRNIPIVLFFLLCAECCVVHAQKVPDQLLENPKFHAKSRQKMQDDASSGLKSASLMISKPFPVGWTWFSLNVLNADMSTAYVLSSLEGTEGDYIKNQTVSSTYYEGTGWFGELIQINPREMYKIKLAKAGILDFEGSVADPTACQITINTGWNWIGYTTQSGKTVTEALSSLSFFTDDYIKNQTQSSTYYEGIGWFGELLNLEPWGGYMLKTSHSGTLIFRESGSFTDARDSKTYPWVKIGSQTWMAANLAYLPSVNPPSAQSTSASYFYVYGYEGTNVSSAKSSINYDTYGVLYNWPAATNACPVGWHLPSDAEWTLLTDYLTSNGYGYGGSGIDIGKSMAAASSLWAGAGGAGNIGNNPASNNLSGFSALPGGYRNLNPGFISIGVHALFWSASAYDATRAWNLYLYYLADGASRFYLTKANGYSVRCLQN